jgi:apolipoprotein D and lipocalin family protein
MARTPTIPDSDYEAMIALADGMGYDVSKIQKVPQQW